MKTRGRSSQDGAEQGEFIASTIEPADTTLVMPEPTPSPAEGTVAREVIIGTPVKTTRYGRRMTPPQRYSA